VRIRRSGIVTAATNSCLNESSTGVSKPKIVVSTFVFGMTFPKPRLAGPFQSSPMFWRMKLMPIAEMSGASLGALRRGR
jgi:hypothetical protein